ncbi:hypothetical protein CANCADRAFT_42520 [Tortispora caseinolytica NRRL Y-17796]|uniref:CAAX prenyl protease n=1 Tax=Tortispora caseinolytica NRRL Y-17796 TaxID=767744 RepID=A0A1E4TJI2_9ASCO|nr:hypothetical protein CANCADRAFT_42520 [Tortispora caseinolytica NRRL Y-17796]
MEVIKTFGELFDWPGFNWKGVIVGITLAKYGLETYLNFRQHQVLKRKEPPKVLKSVIKQETFEKSQKYSIAKSNFGFFSDLYGLVQNLLIIKYDVMPFIWSLASNILPLAYKTEIYTSIVFMLLFQLSATIVSLPLSIYSTFVLEEKFGFNKQTPWLFFTDFLKQLLLLTVIGVPLLAGFLKIIDIFGDTFFFYLWLFMLAVQVIMYAVYPVLIQPLFNKVTPLPEGELRSSVEQLAAKFSFPLKKLYEIDGSRRSTHSNAYFYGLPWSKQIVIYDTLIAQSTVPEVTAVLAHELGHWSLSHTTKLLLIGQAHIFSIFVLFASFIHNKSLYASFGFNTQPALVGFLLFGDLLQPIDSLLQFFMKHLSRKFEYQADAFAVDADYSEDLKNALIKLHVENLSAMDVDPLYSAYNYSHPILAERIAAIDERENMKQKKN